MATASCIRINFIRFSVCFVHKFKNIQFNSVTLKRFVCRCESISFRKQRTFAKIQPRFVHSFAYNAHVTFSPKRFSTILFAHDESNVPGRLRIADATVRSELCSFFRHSPAVDLNISVISTLQLCTIDSCEMSARLAKWSQFNQKFIWKHGSSK